MTRLEIILLILLALSAVERVVAQIRREIRLANLLRDVRDLERIRRRFSDTEGIVGEPAPPGAKPGASWPKAAADVLAEKLRNMRQ